MIFSRITRDFKIYKNKKIFLFGASAGGYQVKEFFDKIDVQITAVLDNDKNKWRKTFDDKIEIISLEKFEQIYETEKENILVQISSEYDNEISKQLQRHNIDFITFSEWKHQIRVIKLSEFYQDNKDLKMIYYDLFKRQTIENDSMKFLDKIAIDVNLVLSAPKTGNWTLRDALKKNSVDYVHIWHDFGRIDERIQEIVKSKIQKIIIGIREPIAQNISYLYEFSGFFWDTEEYWDESNGVQRIFDNYIINKTNKKQCMNEYVHTYNYSYLIQDFFDEQLKKYFGIDIYQYPFDMEKGYQIYNIDNFEIFVYQLEKLNSLQEEIGNFFGINDFHINTRNSADEKWYKRYYDEAKKEIKLRKEYFEECYSGKYIKHFYNDEDIEKFKKRWIKNVIE